MKKIIRQWWSTGVVSLLVILAGFMLRLYRLTLLPIFGDEAIYIRWSQIMRAEPTLRFVPLSDGKQPFFMWATIPFFKLFSDPLFAGRFLSVLCGTATLIGVIILAYFLFKSKKVAIISGAIYALSPFVFFFDRMALADSMLSMFGVWFFIFEVLTVKKVRLDLAMLSGFLLGGALLTKSPALFFVLLLPATWILSKWNGGTKKIAAHLIKLVSLSVVTLAIGYGMYNILKLGPNFNMVAIRNKDYVYPISHLWTNFKDPLFIFIKMAFEWINAMGPWTLLALGTLGAIFNFKKYWREILLLVVLFLAPIAVLSEFAKVFTARYILFSIPFLVVLGSSAFLIKSRVLQTISIITLLILVLQAAKFDYYLLTDPERANLPRSERSGYLEEWTAGTGIKEVADFLTAEAKKNPEQRIVVGTEGFFGTLPDGLQIYVNKNSNITVIGVGIIIDKVHQSLIDSKKFGNPTYLVVNNTRFIADAEQVGLKLLAAYPKAVRPNGGREALLFFEVTPQATFFKATPGKL
ncbi:glycosyltransferase family 39 protein [Patescibacteria group bacterium]|nr:glycosyltransferase family 39 protein [Patescibacteria group bacterium]